MLHRKNRKNTEDLLIKEFILIEGFYVNIILEAKLNKKGLYYLGLDLLLYIGYLKELNKSIIVVNLKYKINFNFFKYKPFSIYRLLYINAIRKLFYLLKLRSSSAEL